MRVISPFSFIDLSSKICLLFVAGFLAKALSPEIYAAWTLLLGFSLLLSYLTSFGFSTTIQRFLPALSNQAQKYYIRLSIFLTAAVSLISCLVLTKTSVYVLSFYNIPSEFEYILLLAPLLGFASSLETILDAYFKVNHLVLRYSLFVMTRISIDISLLFYIFNNYISFSSELKISLLYQFAFAQIILKALLYVTLALSAKSTNTAPNKHDDALNTSTFINYGWPTVLASFVLWCFSNLDRIILSEHLTLVDLGVYSFGSSLASYTSYLGVLVFPLLMLRISKAYDTSQDLEFITQYMNKNISIFIKCLSGFWLLIALFKSEILRFTAGNQYLGSAFPFFVLALYFGIDQAIGTWSYIYHLVKKPKYLTMLRTVYLGLFSLSILVHCRYFDPKYLPLTMLFAGISYNFVLYYIAIHLLPIKLYIRNLGHLFVSLVISTYFYNVSDNVSLQLRLTVFSVMGLYLLHSIIKVEKSYVSMPQEI